MPEAWLNQRCNRLLHANFVILNAACIVAVDESKIGPKKKSIWLVQLGSISFSWLF